MVFFYAQSPHSRLFYTLDFLFTNLSNTPWERVEDYPTFIAKKGIKIYYGEQPPEQPNLIFIQCAKHTLWKDDISPQKLHGGAIKNTPFIFPTTHLSAALPFDIFAATFYMISRYEEYLPFPPDAHGRFAATESVAFQHHFLQLPIVQIWWEMFWEVLRQQCPALHPLPKAYRFIPTYDIDMAWSYLHKRWQQRIGGVLMNIKNREFKLIEERVKVAMGSQNDPFYTFEMIREWHNTHNLPSIYFFLLADYGAYDKNISVKKPAFQKLIRHIAENYPTGIHPSYKASDPKQTPAILETEIQRLETITQKNVTNSRQHFLRLNFPTTYRALIQAGITDDFTMGYADAVGFRAGVAVPFQWFDLLENKITTLTIHPFMAMDATLKQYLNLNPAKAAQIVIDLAKATQKYGGQMITLWHNSSFTEEWKGWKEAYISILEGCKNPINRANS